MPSFKACLLALFAIFCLKLVPILAPSTHAQIIIESSNRLTAFITQPEILYRPALSLPLSQDNLKLFDNRVKFLLVEKFARGLINRYGQNRLQWSPSLFIDLGRNREAIVALSNALSRSLPGQVLDSHQELVRAQNDLFTGIHEFIVNTMHKGHLSLQDILLSTLETGREALWASLSQALHDFRLTLPPNNLAFINQIDDHTISLIGNGAAIVYGPRRKEIEPLRLGVMEHHLRESVVGMDELMTQIWHISRV